MDITNKRILVTGATGLIGSNLVDRLMSSDNTILVTGRNRSKLEATFSEYLSTGRLHILEHDAAEPLPTEVFDIDYVFHAAGPMERDVVMNKPVSVVLPNVVGTINCLDFLRKQEIETGKKGRMIVFSSVTVYANPANEDYTAVESDTTHAIALDQPYACYAESKRMAEVIAQSYKRQYGVDIVIARFSTVYGYCKNIPNTAFFEFINKAIAGEDIILSGTGIPRRDNIYVYDAVEGLITVASKGEIGEAYNISSNGDCNNFLAVDEIAEQIAKNVGEIASTAPVNVLAPQKTKERKGGLILSNNKLKSLGWVIKYSQTKGLLSTIRKMQS